MPDVKSRVQAIQLMWLKRWLSTKNERPLWAYVIDAIIMINAPKAPKTDDESRINWMLQGWQESQSKDSKISKEIRFMLKIAREYNAAVIAPRYSKETKNEWSLWWYIDATQNYLWNKKTAKHIRLDHKVKTVGDLATLKEYGPCTDTYTQMVDKLMGTLSNKTNPLIETPRKVRERKLELTPRREIYNKSKQQKVIFDPDVVAKGTPLKETRIFRMKTGPKAKYGNKEKRIIMPQ